MSLRGVIGVGMATLSLLAVAGCAGGSQSSEQHKGPRTSLPPGGTSQMIHGAGAQKGVTLKAVVYGGSGEVKNPRFDLTPKSGQHFVGVKLGLRNFGTKPFTGDPSLTASVASDNGAVAKALDIGKRGLQGSHLEAEPIGARETVLRGTGQPEIELVLLQALRHGEQTGGLRGSRMGRAGTRQSRLSRFRPAGTARSCAAPRRAPLSRRSSTAAPVRYPIPRCRRNRIPATTSSR